jgi:putative spermidine/putrescine transport system permease protein
MKRNLRLGLLWSWFWMILGWLYFLLPLLATFLFSLRAKKDTLSFLAYERVFKDPNFWKTFAFSLEIGLITILAGLVLIDCACPVCA